MAQHLSQQVAEIHMIAPGCLVHSIDGTQLTTASTLLGTGWKRRWDGLRYSKLLAI